MSLSVNHPICRADSRPWPRPWGVIRAFFERLGRAATLTHEIDRLEPRMLADLGVSGAQLRFDVETGGQARRD